VRRLQKEQERRSGELVSSDNPGVFVIVLEDAADPEREWKDLLLTHLLAANYPPWPGADGLAVDEVLSMYPQASAHGLVPGPAELCDRHPELAEHLRQFFARHPITGRSEN
jgi:hypothetical protein